MTSALSLVEWIEKGKMSDRVAAATRRQTGPRSLGSAIRCELLYVQRPAHRKCKFFYCACVFCDYQIFILF